MTANIIGAVLIFIISVLLTIPIATLMKKTYNNEQSFMDFKQPLERFVFKICRIDQGKGMDWKKYLSTLLLIQISWFAFGFVVLLIQGHLFLKPAHVPDMEWTLAPNSAISFLTSTNLQHYSGGTGATYLSQMSVFMFLQFVSAATSLCAGVAVVRGHTANSTSTPGNFYNDFVKSCTRIFLPLCIIAAIIFIFNGIPMTFKGPREVISMQGDTTQVASGAVTAMILSVLSMFIVFIMGPIIEHCQLINL